MTQLFDLTELERLDLTAREATAVTWEGRKALRLDGLALLKEQTVGDGVVEIDLGVDPGGAYPGLAFHAADAENLELLYCQPHTSGQFDALQYDPVFHGVNTWQVYHGPAYQGVAEVPSGRWFTLRVELFGPFATARILGGTAPDASATLAPDLTGAPGPTEAPLQVYGLAHQPRLGRIGVWTFHPAYFGALRIGPLPRPLTLQPPDWMLPTGTVTRWRLAGHGAVAAERHGILNLNRYLRQENAATAFLTAEFEAAVPGVASLTFGFSDRLRLLVDGQQVFTGVNRFTGFASRAARGYIEPAGDTVILPVGAGRHTVTAELAAEEGFGWGIGLAITGTGISLLPV